MAQSVKNPPAMWETWVWSLGWEIHWRKAWQPTLAFLPGESPWTEEPGGLQSMGSQRVRHNWVTKHTHTQKLDLKLSSHFIHIIYFHLVLSSKQLNLAWVWEDFHFLYLIRYWKESEEHMSSYIHQLWWNTYSGVCLGAEDTTVIQKASALASAATAAKSLQSCLTLCDPIDGSPPGSYPWDSPGKNTGVVCHCLLQCMKVKGKSLSHVRLFATPWTAAYQAPPSMGLYHGRKMDNKLEHNR